MDNYVICKDCGFTFDDKEEGGNYYCPQCQKKRKFYSFTFGCGGKPSELYEKINKK